MRLYSFVNGLYLNQLQYGLQTAHCVSNLSLQDNAMYKDWAENHKTIIILDAMNSKGVRFAADFLELMTTDEIPVTRFYEDNDSLDGAITAAACVLPERVYNNIAITKDEAYASLELYKNAKSITPFIPTPSQREGREYLLSCLIKTYNLAPR